MRKRYASKVTTLENRLLRAEQAIDVQSAAVDQTQTRHRQCRLAAPFWVLCSGARRLSSEFGIERSGPRSRRPAAPARKPPTWNAREAKSRGQRCAKPIMAELEKRTGRTRSTRTRHRIRRTKRRGPRRNRIVRAKSHRHPRRAVTGLVWLPYTKGENGPPPPRLEITVPDT